MKNESMYQYVEAIKKERPRIHNISNRVTIHDCANILLSAGASPIMADDIREVEEVTSICRGLTINIGTLEKEKIPSMILAGKTANQKGIPVLLDPVGLGASTFRQDTVKQLLEEVDFSVIKGNMSEIKVLGEMVKEGKIIKVGKFLGTPDPINKNSDTQPNSHGIDANKDDMIMEKNLPHKLVAIKELASYLKTIVIASGPMDILTDGRKTAVIENGHPYMEKITGAGCMLSSLITAFISTRESQNHIDGIFYAAVTGLATMGIAGEVAYLNLMHMSGGSASYGRLLIDAIDLMESKLWLKKAKIRWI